MFIRFIVYFRNDDLLKREITMMTVVCSNTVAHDRVSAPKYSKQWLFAVRTILQVDLEQMKIRKFCFPCTVAFVM